MRVVNRRAFGVMTVVSGKPARVRGHDGGKPASMCGHESCKPANIRAHETCAGPHETAMKPRPRMMFP